VVKAPLWSATRTRYRNSQLSGSMPIRTLAASEWLLAAEVTLGRLNRNAPQEELNRAAALVQQDRCPPVIALLASQRRGRTDLHRAEAGEIAGQQRRGQQDCRHNAERQRVERFDTI
jgi:hypothetical protein